MYSAWRTTHWYDPHHSTHNFAPIVGVELEKNFEDLAEVERASL